MTRYWRRKGILMESRTLEYKENISKSFLKTVSAFANYVTGKIVFGIADDETIAGVDDPAEASLTIENMINDSLKPVPRYTLESVCREGKTLLFLTVYESPDKPYFYKGKAYRRSNTADVEVRGVELNRLVLEGMNTSFEAVTSREQDLHFSTLQHELQKTAGIEEFDRNTLKILRLYSDKGGYNNAAAVLADTNTFSGTDIVRFGSGINEIRDRRRFVGVSAIEQLHGALEMYRLYYQSEVIEGSLRVTKEHIPEEAFREAVANALVHRLWDSNANIQISMDDKGIRIVSPGGLPDDISYENYVEGVASVLRNPIIANVFFRLDYIEMFGTGVRKIKRAYEESHTRPRFSASENYLTVELPVVDSFPVLDADEQAAYDCFADGRVLARPEIQKELGFTQSKTIRILRTLVDKGVVLKTGSGPSTRYEAL